MAPLDLATGKPTWFHWYGTPGDPILPVIKTELGRIGGAICYDFEFPDLMRQAGKKRIDINRDLGSKQSPGERGRCFPCRGEWLQLVSMLHGRRFSGCRSISPDIRLQV
ncbi:uncharacterized protein LOC112343824 [Selaginella moellendorffii]|uniref:uncharacterized protein LOC112343824 n=1 Tax=Selaginella moellendorffii TaxID=88036 RepID=UPI000D1CCAB6|nr:uncharacterized protein LOC112343824 [Selaginella moellendorffii]|eukprot:XP_024523629.1 uncharacterized protein LOC112343824 [Selaginella moellendorffii]